MSNRIKVDVAKIRTAIQSGVPLTITSYTLPHEMEEYMADVLKAFLAEVNQTHMVDSLSYCLKELINNAKKANTKRVYFAEKGLNIHDMADYEKGMSSFKEDTLSNIHHYLDLQKKNGLYIKVVLQTKNNKVKVEVRNKVELSYFEYKRIHDKITRAQQYKNVEDCMSHVLDDAEGAGLGLVILILVLKKIGLTEENYQVFSERGETITRLILPFDALTQKNISEISNEFVKYIEGLPELPENIVEIKRLIENPDSRMSDIAKQISNDVSLTAELLRMVNSAAFAMPSTCHTIGDAVKMAGLRGIRNMLISIGSVSVLSSNSDAAAKALWRHSYKVAFYSYNLARNYAAGDRICIDDSYVCGLLHDMGKIVFETARADVLEVLYKMSGERGMSADLLERLIAGVNHGEIGALIAEKWNFPSTISDVIRYHHDPECAPNEIRKLSTIVYFADLLAHFSEGSVDCSQFDFSVLQMFNLETKEDLMALNNKLSRAFLRSQDK